VALDIKEGKLFSEGKPWERKRANITLDANLYSAPYTLVQEMVEVRATPTTVEIFHKGQRVASHLRALGREQVVTERAHQPKSHQAHLEWTPSRMVNWAERVGPQTARLFERILAEKPHPEMGYRSCLGIIRLAEQYSAARMEAAADRALRAGAYRYQSVKSILRNSLDQQPLTEEPALPPPPSHDNIRGAGYFSEGVK
jgi:transposase